MNRIYAYLRASTKEQDENRGRKALAIVNLLGCSKSTISKIAKSNPKL
jgi:DNA invertase Pin-like site-specific DNA recombinase